MPLYSQLIETDAIACALRNIGERFPVSHRARKHKTVQFYVLKVKQNNIKQNKQMKPAWQAIKHKTDKLF